jgi:hypothetical protein
MTQTAGLLGRCHFKSYCTDPIYCYTVFSVSTVYVYSRHNSLCLREYSPNFCAFTFRRVSEAHLLIRNPLRAKKAVSGTVSLLWLNAFLIRFKFHIINPRTLGIWDHSVILLSLSFKSLMLIYSLPLSGHFIKNSPFVHKRRKGH